MNIRILFIGQNWHGSNSTSFKRAFRHLGCDVLDIDDYHFFPRWERPYLKILRRLLYNTIVADFNAHIRLQAQRFEPDLVFVFKGTMLRNLTLQALRSSGARVFNFYPDADILNNEQHQIFVQGVPEYDCIFTPKSFHVHDLTTIGAKRVEFLPYAYDPWCHFPVEMTSDEKNTFDSDVVFVGTWEKERARILESLVSTGVHFNLTVWGNQWERLAPNSPLRKYVMLKPANGMTQAKVFGNTKIALAFLKSPDLHTARTFEIPSFNVFMLAQRTSEHNLFFEEAREIACFEGVDELREKITYYLANDTERQSIGLAGHEKVTQKGHSYIDRAISVLETYREILK